MIRETCETVLAGFAYFSQNERRPIDRRTFKFYLVINISPATVPRVRSTTPAGWKTAAYTKQGGACWSTHASRGCSFLPPLGEMGWDRKQPGQEGTRGVRAATLAGRWRAGAHNGIIYCDTRTRGRDALLVRNSRSGLENMERP